MNTLVDFLKEKWRIYKPLFVCKETRKQNDAFLAEAARVEEYVKKHEIFLALKGLSICTFQHTPSYKGNKQETWIAYVTDDSGHMVTSYCLSKNVLWAKHEAIYKYYRKYGRPSV